MNLSKYGNGSSRADVGVEPRRGVAARCLSGSGQMEVWRVGKSVLAPAWALGHGDVVGWGTSWPCWRRGVERPDMVLRIELAWSTETTLAAELSGLAGLAELAAAERSLARCSRCRMAGGGLSKRLHLTPCRIQAEHGRFSSHCRETDQCWLEADIGGRKEDESESKGSAVEEQSIRTAGAGRDSVDTETAAASYLDPPLATCHTPVARLCVPKSRHRDWSAAPSFNYFGVYV